MLQIQEEVMRHMRDRDWDKNPPRGLAISILLEAAELLEHYQWTDDSVGDNKELEEEVADILIYVIQFAALHDIDIALAIEHKLAKAAKKYPASHFKGKDRETARATWYKDKLSHNKNGL